MRALDNGRGCPREAAEAAREDGVGALHLAAGNGQLEVCSYLVEELRVDVDAADDEGLFLSSKCPLPIYLSGDVLCFLF